MITNRVKADPRPGIQRLRADPKLNGSGYAISDRDTFRHDAAREATLNGK